MLPGVELARRRRFHHHHYETKPRSSPETPINRPPMNRPAVIHQSTAMEESALIARGRLEGKLRRFSASLLLPPQSPRLGSRTNQTVSATNNSRRLMLERKESMTDVCTVCLDRVMEQQRPVTRLPCSHRYHSDCLRPWLDEHSNCPSCRTTVPLPISSLFKG